MRTRPLFGITVTVFLLTLMRISAFGQETSTATNPEGFSTIIIGMSLDEAKQALKTSPLFKYRGDPDVSLLPRPNEVLIETEGFTYIDRAYFQFYDGGLYTIILLLNREELDHFTLYTTLVDKYGEPSYLDPSEVVWEFERLRLAIERPLTVKYVDTVAFDEILRENAKAESLNRLNRENFLGEF
ncbi:MAG: hypothetical protein CMN78_01850 [Spirochaetales bacterium]|nr:hypothetical protein [Spirochaetales bacterium]